MSRWALVAGARGGEKTARVRAAVEALRARGVALGGFVQDPIDEGDARVAYEVRRLTTGERVRMARPQGAAPAAREEEFCSMVFDGDAFDRARAWLEADAAAATVLVVDEVSKLEAAGRGHARAIERALASDKVIALLCVRADQLFAVVERFGLADPIATLTPDEGSPEALAEALATASVEARS